jgi:hypothetical protein
MFSKLSLKKHRYPFVTQIIICILSKIFMLLSEKSRFCTLVFSSLHIPHICMEICICMHLFHFSQRRGAENLIRGKIWSRWRLCCVSMRQSGDIPASTIIINTLFLCLGVSESAVTGILINFTCVFIVRLVSIDIW